MATTSEKTTPVRKTEPSHPLAPFEDLERWFDETFPRVWTHRGDWPFWGEFSRRFDHLTPRIDVVERDEEIVVRAEVPGIKKDDLDVSVTENTVTIRGSKKEESKEEKDEYYRCEIAQGDFSRTVTLPGNVDTDKVSASFDDGMLELKLPKVNKARRRTISLD